MMIKPGITELDRCVDSRYTLVAMSAKRARMIGAERNKAENSDAESVYNTKLEKPVTQAVCEISAGLVGYVRSAAVDRAKVYEEEKFQAITQLQSEALAAVTAEDNEGAVAAEDNEEAVTAED